MTLSYDFICSPLDQKWPNLTWEGESLAELWVEVAPVDSGAEGLGRVLEDEDTDIGVGAAYTGRCQSIWKGGHL